MRLEADRPIARSHYLPLGFFAPIEQLKRILLLPRLQLFLDEYNRQLVEVLGSI